MTALAEQRRPSEVIAELPDEQFNTVEQNLRFTFNPHFTGGHWPDSPQQHAFMTLEDELDVLYGGAAGGGKSDALLMAGLQFVHVPGYAAMILRRKLTDLEMPGGLIPRSRQWLDNTTAKWNDNKHMWTFTSGASLSFGYCDHLSHLTRYQGSELQYVAFDEATQFPRRWVMYLFSRLRKPPICPEHGRPDSEPRCQGVYNDSDQLMCEICGRVAPALHSVPLRMRLASNPGGIGNEWIKKRYILKVPHDNSDRELDDAQRRWFIPAKIKDNKHVDQESAIRALEQLEDTERAQLLDGDWDAREPGNWVIPDKSWIDAAVEFADELVELWNARYRKGLPVVPQGNKTVICIDWGEITQAYTIWPLEGGGVYVLPSETVGRHEDPAHVTPRILENHRKFGWPAKWAAYDAAGVQSMRTFINTARAEDDYEMLKAKKIAFSKYKRETMGYMRSLFKRTAEGYDTRVIGIHRGNPELLRQLPRWERKSEELDEVDKKKGDDHGPDAILAGIAPIAQAHRKTVDQEYEAAKQEDDQTLTEAALEAFEAVA